MYFIFNVDIQPLWTTRDPVWHAQQYPYFTFYKFYNGLMMAL
jgi:hypothetical protein